MDVKDDDKNESVARGTEAAAADALVSRFFLDERVGCIAVRDRKHPKYDPRYPGLHFDTADVVFYAHGERDGDGNWVVWPRQKMKAQTVLWHLAGLERQSESESEKDILQCWLDGWVSSGMPLYGNITYARVREVISRLGLDGAEFESILKNFEKLYKE